MVLPGPEAQSVFVGGGPRMCERSSRGSTSSGPVLMPRQQWMSWPGICLLALLCFPCMCGCLLPPALA
eukprot:1046065-Pelagomonas_calceolata.AAC.1